MERTEGTICFWSWNYSISLTEAERQIREFAEKGYSGFLIHSRCGLKTPYLGNEWMACYRRSMEVAEELGLIAYIYDEDGWPSGYAGGLVPRSDERYWYKELRYGYKRPEDHSVLAVFRPAEDYRRIPPGGERDGDLYFWYVTDSHYVDWLMPGTMEAFLQTTHEPYKKQLGRWFGTVIKGFFTDEPQLSVGGFPWSPALEDRYNAEYHEELSEQLWRLIAPGQDDFRRRFWHLVNDQMADCFTKPYSAWCRQNGLVLTGHFAAEDGLCDQISANGGLLRHYVHMGLPGIDYLGNRQPSPVLLKQPAGIARQFHSGRVLSESFGCSGWGTSFEEWLYNWGWESVLGITQPCLHLAAYTMAGRRKRDYPAFFSYQEPWWDAIPDLIGWMDGLNDCMTDGVRMTDTLVVSPLSGATGAYEGQQEDRTTLRRLSASYRILLENLLDIQIDFDVTDESILYPWGSLENGRIRIGNVTYGTVYVAENPHMDEDTARMLMRFADMGGQLICVGAVPQTLLDCADMPITTVMNRRALLEKDVLSRGVCRPAAVLDPDTGRTASDVVMHCRSVADGKRVHLLNRRTDGTRRVMLHLPESAGAYRRDIRTGEREALPCVGDGRGGAFIRLTLYPRQSVVIDAVRETVTAPEDRLTAVCTVDPPPELTDRNTLTIDRVCYRIDAGEYSEEMPVTAVADIVFADSCDYPRMMWVRYSFRCDFLPQDATLALEDGSCREISLNGHSLTGKRPGWWMDREIGEYPVDRFLRPGENELVLSYDLPPCTCPPDVHAIFETERNRFCYPVEPEAVYLRGSFDVVPRADAGRELLCYAVPDEGFSVTAPTNKKYGELTRQGLWFYRGNVRYTFPVEGIPGKRIFLRIPEYDGALIEWQVNGHSGRIVEGDRSAELTAFLREGENTVFLLLYGTNRNLLGPHHHVMGEPELVGPDTFRGTFGWEDFVSPQVAGRDTYAGRYAFIPFGIREIRIETYEQTDSQIKEW